MQICGEALESAYWLQIAVRSDGNVMRFVAHIDPRSAGMDYLQPGILRSQPPRQLLPLLAIPPQLLVYRHLGSPWWGYGDTVRPGDERFKNLPNGVKGPVHQGPCHHASDRQYRGHAEYRARSTSEVSALACRTGSRIRLQKGETLDKFLAPVTCRRPGPS